MSLYARLMEMTKVEIDDIRRLLNCDVKSGLNKRRMVLGVAEDLCRRKCALPLRHLSDHRKKYVFLILLSWTD